MLLTGMHRIFVCMDVGHQQHQNVSQDVAQQRFRALPYQPIVFHRKRNDQHRAYDRSRLVRELQSRAVVDMNMTAQNKRCIVDWMDVGRQRRDAAPKFVVKLMKVCIPHNICEFSLTRFINGPNGALICI